jgi:hypothetical protein
VIQYGTHLCKVSNPITVENVLECYSIIDEYTTILHTKIDTAITDQIKNFKYEEFLALKEKLKVGGDRFIYNWTRAYINYSVLVFSKDFVTTESEFHKILPAHTAKWVSLKELNCAIEKIKSTEMVDFDEAELLKSCIVNIILGFLKEIFPSPFQNATEHLQKANHRKVNYKTANPETPDTQGIKFLDELLKRIPTTGDLKETINPSNTKSPIRGIIFPRLDSVHLFSISDFMETGAHIQTLGLLKLKENAVKQIAYLSAIDLINIIHRPQYIVSHETWATEKRFKSKYSTLSDYFKVYAKKKILRVGIFQ